MYGNFVKHISYIDDFPFFNKETFLMTKHPDDLFFYEEFTEIQMFNQLMQNSKLEETFPYFYKENQLFLDYQYKLALNNKSNKSNSKCSLFNMSTYFETLNSAPKLTSSDMISSMSDEKKIDAICSTLSENYVLRPYFLDEFEEITEKEKFDELVTKRYSNDYSYKKKNSNSLFRKSEESLDKNYDFLISNSVMYDVDPDSDYYFYKYTFPEIEPAVYDRGSTNSPIRRHPRFRKSTVVRYSEYIKL